MRNEQRPLRWYDYYAGILGVLLVLISGIGFLYSDVPKFPLLTMLVFGMFLLLTMLVFGMIPKFPLLTMLVFGMILNRAMRCRDGFGGSTVKTTVSYLYSVNGTWQTGNNIYAINEERLTDYDEAKALFDHTKKNPAVRTLYLLRHVRKTETETMRVWKNPKL